MKNESASTLPMKAGEAASLPGRLLSGRRIPELDGLRGIAILLVLMVHYGANQLHPPSGSVLNYIREGLAVGWCGVDLFFVLSGFLIGGILMQNRDSENYFKTFYLRRLARIFPLYYGWLILSVILFALPLAKNVHHLVEPAIPFWSYFAYVQNITSLPLGDFGPEWYGPTWSLAVEEQFYLLFPLLVRFCPTSRLPGTLAVLALSATSFRVLAYFFAPSHGFAAYLLLPCRWDSLMLGALVAWLVRQPAAVDQIKRNLWALYAACGVILIAILGLRGAHEGSLLSQSNALIGYLLLAIFFCCLLLLSLYSKNPLIRAVVTNRWLGQLGVISYCVYLIHQPVAYLVHGLIWQREPLISSVQGLLTTGLALVATIIIASLSWRFFESRCVRWGRRFAY